MHAWLTAIDDHRLRLRPIDLDDVALEYSGRAWALGADVDTSAVAATCDVGDDVIAAHGGGVSISDSPLVGAAVTIRLSATVLEGD